MIVNSILILTLEIYLFKSIVTLKSVKPSLHKFCLLLRSKDPVGWQYKEKYFTNDTVDQDDSIIITVNKYSEAGKDYNYCT